MYMCLARDLAAWTGALHPTLRIKFAKQPMALPNVKPNKAYSAGIPTHDRLFVSTMLGSDPSNGNATGSPSGQVDLALDRLKTLVEAAGLTLLQKGRPFILRRLAGQVLSGFIRLISARLAAT
jgi:hypothetical protein